MRILVSNIFHRKAFDVISVIKYKFPTIPLILGIEEKSKISKLKAHLIYSDKIQLLRTDNKNEFIEDIYKISELHYNESIVYIPLEENTTDHFLYFIEIFGKRNFLFLLPSREIFELVRNKLTLNEFCLAKGFPCPKLYSYCDIFSNDDIYPIILKPAKGSGGEGIFRLYKREDFSQKIRNAIEKREYLIQELLPDGKNVIGGFFLFHNNKIIGTYSHKRIRTSPDVGGVSVLSKMYKNTDIQETGINFLQEIAWEGLIMLEFIFDKETKNYKLIEANPRIWGSILLSEYSNANLLTNYIKICIGRDIDRVEKNYSAQIRWLFPVDIFNYFKRFGMIKNFWDFKNTCFINFTYSKIWSSILFNAFSLLNVKNLKRIFR